MKSKMKKTEESGQTLDRLKRKHLSYYKIKIAPITKLEIDDQMAELVEGMKKILDEIWSADPKMLLVPWKDEGHTIKPIKKTGKYQLQKMDYAIMRITFGPNNSGALTFE